MAPATKPSPPANHAAPPPPAPSMSAAASKKLDPSVVQHDIFNLGVIMTLITLTLTYLATGKTFPILWWLTMAYFFVDIIWVVLVPKSVKGGGTIIAHHIITLFFVLIPFFHPKYQTLMCLNMLVEVNTWLLIVKRHYKSLILEVLFYSTWVVMRLIVYPYLVVYYLKVYREAAAEFGTHVTILVLAPVIQFILSGMNVWWTVTMLTQLAARRSAKAATSLDGKQK